MDNFKSSDAALYLQNGWRESMSRMVDSSLADKPDVWKASTSAKGPGAWTGGTAPWSAKAEEPKFLSMLWDAWDASRHQEQSMLTGSPSMKSAASPASSVVSASFSSSASHCTTSSADTDLALPTDALNTYASRPKADPVSTYLDVDGTSRRSSLPAEEVTATRRNGLHPHSRTVNHLAGEDSLAAVSNEDPVRAIDRSEGEEHIREVDKVEDRRRTEQESELKQKGSPKLEARIEQEERLVEEEKSRAEEERAQKELKRRKKEEKAIAFALAKKERKEEKERRRHEELQKRREEEELKLRAEAEKENERRAVAEAEQRRKDEEAAAQDIELELISNAANNMNLSSTGRSYLVDPLSREIGISNRGEEDSSSKIFNELQRHRSTMLQKNVREHGLAVFNPNAEDREQARLRRRIERALKNHEDKKIASKDLSDPAKLKEKELAREGRRKEWKAASSRIHQRAEPPRSCSKCGKPGSDEVKIKICKGCSRRGYCSKECQQADWKKRHKEQCSATKAVKEKSVEDIHEWSKLYDTLLQRISAVALKIYTPRALNLSYGICITLSPAVPLYRIDDTPLADRYKVLSASVEEVVPLSEGLTHLEQLRAFLHGSYKLMRQGEPGYALLRIRIQREEGDPLAGERLEPILMFKVRKSQVAGKEWLDWLKTGVRRREIEKLDLGDLFSVLPETEAWRTAVAETLWRDAEDMMDIALDISDEGVQ
ncbi:hypothetical protein BT69DRAFT_1354317 [Atractiella rhizophila]|nr:hypothetical protein BT69DRAFT_1354317 [Atractiella rhizophila]